MCIILLQMQILWTTEKKKTQPTYSTCIYYLQHWPFLVETLALIKNANAKTREGLSTRLYELASVSP